MTFSIPLCLFPPSATNANWSLYDGTKNKSPVVVGSFNASGCHIVPIDATRSLLLVRGDPGAGTALYAAIAQINGSGVATIGTLVSVGPDIGSTGGAAVCIMDSTHAVIAYYDSSIPGTAAVAISFSGTTISSVGTAVTFFSGTMNVPRTVNVCSYSSSAFLIIGDDGASHMKAYYGTLSGTTITAPASNSATISAANISNGQRWTGLAAFDGTYAVVSWVDNTLTQAVACVVTISGNTPVGTVPITLSVLTDIPGNFLSVFAKKIDSTHALLAWCFDNTVTGNTHVQAAVLTLATGNITAGTVVEVYNPGTAGTPNIVTVGLPNATQAVFGYNIAGTDMRIQVVTISGSTLTALTSYEINTSTSVTSGVCEIGANYCGFFYPDSTDSNHCKLSILSPV